MSLKYKELEIVVNENSKYNWTQSKKHILRDMFKNVC
jgi:hypothetical protein